MKELAEYGQAEDRGVHLLKQMRAFVPESAKAYLEKQIEDEERHARLFEERCQALGITDDYFMPALDALYTFAQRCVDQKDWLLCMLCQSVIEELAMISFGRLHDKVDSQTQAVLQSIMKDEADHLEFTLTQLQGVHPQKVQAFHNDLKKAILPHLLSIDAELKDRLQEVQNLHFRRLQNAQSATAPTQ